MRTFIRFINIALIGGMLVFKTNLAIAGLTDLYFPPAEGKWETVPLEENGWNVAKLSIAMEYAGEQNSSGVVILFGGRILAEQYWKLKSAEDERSLYKYMLVNSTTDGRSIEEERKNACRTKLTNRKLMK